MSVGYSTGSAAAAATAALVGDVQKHKPILPPPAPLARSYQTSSWVEHQALRTCSELRHCHSSQQWAACWCRDVDHGPSRENRVSIFLGHWDGGASLPSLWPLSARLSVCRSSPTFFPPSWLLWSLRRVVFIFPSRLLGKSRPRPAASDPPQRPPPSAPSSHYQPWLFSQPIFFGLTSSLLSNGVRTTTSHPPAPLRCDPPLFHSADDYARHDLHHFKILVQFCSKRFQTLFCRRRTTLPRTAHLPNMMVQYLAFFVFFNLQDANLFIL